jgi:hypothetical protein
LFPDVLPVRLFPGVLPVHLLTAAKVVSMGWKAVKVVSMGWKDAKAVSMGWKVAKAALRDASSFRMAAARLKGDWQMNRQSA